jgi:hypothetical protein
MRRVTTYPGAIPLEVDVLNGQKNTMIAIGHVLQDMIGTSTLFSGLGCVPTAPAGMTVNVNPGRAYSLQSTDTGAYSSLNADATPLVKQGILLAAQNFSCPAPTTAGFSINYLVQGAFQEVDGGSTVLPYYNASNPAQAYSGPNGTGTSNTTYRDNTVQLQLKAGVAATTGSQITPTPDAGFNGLWVVTVPFGASTITSANISQYSGAPFLTASLLSMIQQSGLYAVATGTANAHVAAFSPPITTRTDGMVLRYKAPAANTGALTFNDGLGAVAVVGAAHAALQGGETAVNGDVWLQWNSSIGGGSYVLIDSTGGAVQVSPGTQSQHAVQMGQVAAVRGTFSNLKLSASGASSTVNISADQLVVRDANGLAYVLSGLSLAPTTGGATGANSLDTGAWAFSTWYAVFVIYNPTTQTTAALFSLSATAPTLPSGYTAWARVGWIRTLSATNYWALGFKQNGRTVRYLPGGTFPVMLSAGSASSYTAIATGNFVPSTASKVGVYSYSQATAATNWVGIISADGSTADFNISGNGSYGWVNEVFILLVSTNIYYTTAGTSPSLYLGCSGWEDNL